MSDLLYYTERSEALLGGGGGVQLSLIPVNLGHLSFIPKSAKTVIPKGVSLFYLLSPNVFRQLSHIPQIICPVIPYP